MIDQLRKPVTQKEGIEHQAMMRVASSCCQREGEYFVASLASEFCDLVTLSRPMTTQKVVFQEQALPMVLYIMWRINRYNAGMLTIANMEMTVSTLVANNELD